MYQAILVIMILLFVSACGGGSGGGGDSEPLPPTNGPVVDDGADDTGSASARLLLEETFTGGQFNPLWNWTEVNEQIYSQNRVEAFPRMEGQGEVLHYYIPQGADEVSPASVSVLGEEGFLRVTGQEEVDEFFIQWKEFFPENHDFADGSQKMMRFTYWKQGAPRGVELNWWVQFNNGNLQLFMSPSAGQDDSATVAINLGWGIPTGRWVTFAVWAKLNTPGSSDGFARVYMDGRRIISISNLRVRGNDTWGWNQMWIGGVHSNRGATTQASSRFIDDIRWYDTKPINP